MLAQDKRASSNTQSVVIAVTVVLIVFGLILFVYDNSNQTKLLSDPHNEGDELTGYIIITPELKGNSLANLSFDTSSMNENFYFISASQNPRLLNHQTSFTEWFTGFSDDVRVSLRLINNEGQYINYTDTLQFDNEGTQYYGPTILAYHTGVYMVKMTLSVNIDHEWVAVDTIRFDLSSNNGINYVN